MNCRGAHGGVGSGAPRGREGIAMKGRSGGEHLPVHRITLITLKYANPPYHINFNICNSKNVLQRASIVDCDCAPV